MNKPDLRKTLVGFLLAWTLVILSLNILGLPLLWVALAIAFLSFAISAHYAWFPTKARARIPGRVTIYIFFGCLSLLLAGVAWMTPVPAPSLIVSFSLLAGGLSGVILVWFFLRHASGPRS